MGDGRVVPKSLDMGNIRATEFELDMSASEQFGVMGWTARSRVTDETKRDP